MSYNPDAVCTVPNLWIPVLQKWHYERASNCCVYKTLVDGPDSRDRRISAIYSLSDSKKNLVASGATHGN
jgi:hypothetical protein